MRNTVLIIVVGLASLTARADSSGAFEFYSARPHVSVVKSASVKGRTFTKTLEGYLNYLIEVYLLYEGKQRVHLARDGEIAYDMDWLVWKELEKIYPKTWPEPRLLNVSRLSQTDPHLTDYLRQNQFSDNARSEPIVLLDTGYEGTIFNTIEQMFPKAPLQAHMITSTHERIPSSRVATVPFYKKLTADTREEFLDAVDSQIDDAIEDLPHFTDTATTYKRDPKSGRYEAVAESVTELSVKRKAVAIMAQTRSFAKSKSTRDKVLLTLEVLRPLVTKLKGAKALQRAEVEKVAAEVEELKFGLFWLDLRETVAKGTFEARSERMAELWQYLPGGRPELFDLEDDEQKALEKLEDEKGLNQKDVQQEVQAPKVKNKAKKFLIEEIMAHHKRAKEPSSLREREKVFRPILKQIEDDKLLVIDGQRLDVGSWLNDGARAEVYPLGKDLIVKQACDVDDMRYLEVEVMVANYLTEHYKRYGIKVLPAIAEGPLGSYLVKKRLPKESLGESIVKKSPTGLPKEQLKKLRRLYEGAKLFAFETGVGLDIKYDNIAWDGEDWLVFDVGPRTSYGPYAMTLDVPDFDTFLKLFTIDEPRRDGLTIDEFLEQKRSGRKCENLLQGDMGLLEGAG